MLLRIERGEGGGGFGAFRRHERRHHGQWVIDPPLAKFEIVAPLGEIKVDMVLVIPVRAGSQHGGEPRTDRCQHFFTSLTRDSTIGQRQRAAIRKLQPTHIECVGQSVFGKLGSLDAIAATAFE